MKLRYGIISTATIAPRFIKAVQTVGDEVIAIASRTLEKAERMAQEHSVPKAYDSYQKVYEDPDIDIVYIATPNNTHASEAMEALLHHKHVVVEKPFALTPEEALEVFRFAMEQNCFVMEAQKSVFLPATIQLKKLLDEQVLGACEQILMLSSFPGSYPPGHWMFRPYGGTINASGTYTIEYLMYLFDDPTFEASACCDIAPEGAIIDAGIHLLMNEHLLVDSHITMKVKTHNVATFYCERGYIQVDNFWKARHIIVHPYEGEEQVLDFPVEYEMMYEVQHIHDCIAQGRNDSWVMTPERTILCTQIVHQLVEDQKADA